MAPVEAFDFDKPPTTPEEAYFRLYRLERLWTKIAARLSLPSS